MQGKLTPLGPKPWIELKKEKLKAKVNKIKNWVTLPYSRNGYNTVKHVYLNKNIKIFKFKI